MVPSRSSDAGDPRTKNPQVAIVNLLYRKEERRRKDAVLLNSGYTFGYSLSRC